MAPHVVRIIAVAALYFAISNPCAAGDDAAPALQSPAAQRVAAQFEPLAGSPQNAQRLVQGLRTGTAITLASSSASVTFTPATRPMGYGNISKALLLAQRDLAARGIVNPTPAQLQVALMGGTLVTAGGTVQMPGILQLRSMHMGWGQIAHTLSISPTSRMAAMAQGNAPPPGSSRGAIVTGNGTLAHGGAPSTSGGATTATADSHLVAQANGSAHAQAGHGRF
jgi:hypothetical protein